MKNLRLFFRAFSHILTLLALVSVSLADDVPIYIAVDERLSSETVRSMPAGYRAIGLKQFRRLTGYTGPQADLNDALTSRTREDILVPIAWLSNQSGYRVEDYSGEGCLRIVSADGAGAEVFLGINGILLAARKASYLIDHRQLRLELVGANTKLLTDAFGLRVGERSYVPLRETAEALGLAVDSDGTTSVLVSNASESLILERDTEPLRTRQFRLWRTEPVIETESDIYLDAESLAAFAKCRLSRLEEAGGVHLVAADALASPADVFREGPALGEALKNRRRTSGKLYKTAWLTFDDGPSARVTPAILDVLDRYNVKATFFILGQEAAKRPEILKRLVDSGHTVGNHTWSHVAKTLYGSPEGFFEEIEKTGAFLEKFTAAKVRLVRAPYGPWGNFKSGHYEGMKKRGLRLVNWNVVCGDGRSSKIPVEDMVEEVGDGAENKNEIVVLMHDSASKEQTARALPRIIEFLRSEGYDLLPLDADTVVHAKGVIQ